MKHRKSGRQFGRKRSQRKALLRTMVGSLIMYEQIETTQAKAKELKSVIDRVITRAKRANGDQMQLVRKLEVDVPLTAIKKLSGTFLSNFAARDSGYTRVVKMAPRKSDSAEMALITFVDDIAKEDDKDKKNTDKDKKDKGNGEEKKEEKEQVSKEKVTA